MQTETRAGHDLPAVPEWELPMAELSSGLELPHGEVLLRIEFNRHARRAIIRHARNLLYETMQVRIEGQRFMARDPEIIDREEIEDTALHLAEEAIKELDLDFNSLELQEEAVLDTEEDLRLWTEKELSRHFGELLEQWQESGELDSLFGNAIREPSLKEAWDTRQEEEFRASHPEAFGE